MAKENSYRDILTDIRNKKFAPVYLLMGEEPYNIDRIMEALEENVVSEEERDFNAFTFYGPDVKPDQVIASARQLPMMSERQLVLLKEAQGMFHAKVSLDKFASYILNPNEKSVLAIAFKGDNLNATSAIIKAASKSNAVIFKSPLKRDYQLAAPIREYCNEKKISIDDEAITLLGDYIGTSLEALFSAIDKIIISKGDSGSSRIHVQDVAINIGMSREYNIFELVSAIGEKNHRKAQLILRYFRQNPKQNPAVMVSTQLFNYFSKIVIAHLSKDKSDAALMAATSTNSAYAFKHLKNSIRLFNMKQAAGAIGAIREFDAKSKGIESLMDEAGLLSELVFKLFTFRV